MKTIKEALEDGSLNLEDEIDYDDTPQAEEIALLKLEKERLNNIIRTGIEAINVYQNEKTLSVGYQDLKIIRGILQGNEIYLKMFEEYLQELKGNGSNENL